MNCSKRFSRKRLYAQPDEEIALHREDEDSGTGCDGHFEGRRDSREFGVIALMKENAREAWAGG